MELLTELRAQASEATTPAQASEATNTAQASEAITPII